MGNLRRCCCCLVLVCLRVGVGVGLGVGVEVGLRVRLSWLFVLRLLVKVRIRKGTKHFQVTTGAARSTVEQIARSKASHLLQELQLHQLLLDARSFFCGGMTIAMSMCMLVFTDVPR